MHVTKIIKKQASKQDNQIDIQTLEKRRMIRPIPHMGLGDGLLGLPILRSTILRA